MPLHRLPGIGVDRQELTDDALALRAEAMIQSQTFGIMREPLAAQGAERIHGSGLERLFRDAERKSGFPSSVLQAMAYLESWGVADAESPAGPRGILPERPSVRRCWPEARPDPGQHEPHRENGALDPARDPNPVDRTR